MRIGIGVTTYNRPQHLELFKSQIEKYLPKDAKLFIAFDDIERKGIAFRKNECLENLKDCDYIFLFDDDCFPIKEGWADYFISESNATKQQHFMYLKETATIQKIRTVANVDEYDNCGGAMLFLTKEVIEKVGGFCKDYGRYGFEHAGYSNRIHQAGLTPMGAYLCPADAKEYIYAMDYDNYLTFNKQVKHAPSMSNEIGNISHYIKVNSEIYQKDIQTIYQPI